MNNIIEELFKINQERIDKIEEESGETKNVASDFTYSFVKSTLAEAQAFTLTDYSVRIITDARKNAEGVGSGTGLPAFYDPGSSSWMDFSGGAIIV